MTDDPTLPLGEADALIDGRYRPVRLLGKGGFGEVHLVEDTLQSDERLALKLILGRHADSREFEQRFRNEIRVLRSLHHEGIPQIYNDGRTPTGAYYFTMAYVEGRSLDHVLGQEGTLPPLRVAHMVRQLVSVLEYAHARGVVHRDLKPGNVLVVGEGTAHERIRVLDFGIAKILDREGPLERAVTMDTMGPIGTPHYMSPEQVRGRDVDGATDYFALGVMIYHMVTGAYPYGGTTLHEMIAARLTDPPAPLPPGAAPPWLVRVVEGLLERDRAKRARAADVSAALTAGLEGLATETRRHRKWLVVLAAAVAVLAVGVLITALRDDEGPGTGAGAPLVAEGASTPTPPAAIEKESELGAAAPRGDALTRDDASDARPGPELDLDAPGVALEPGSDARLVGAEVTLFGRAVPPPGARVTTLEVDGERAALRDDGAFSFVLDGLSEGRRNVAVIATDDTGGRSRAVFELEIDRTPPRIEILTRELATSAARLELELEAADPHLERVTFDGIAQDVDARGRFTVPLELRHPGTFRFTVTARDRAGNDATRTIEVERLASAPRLVESKPADGARLDAATERVAVSVTSSEPLARATVAGVEATLDAADPRRCHAEVPLALDENALEVVLESEHGARSSATLTLFRLAPPVPPGFAPIVEEGLRAGHFARIVHLDLGLELVLLPPVRIDVDGKKYEVSRPVYVGRYEVTHEQFRQFLVRAGRAPSGSVDLDDSAPATGVTHADAVAFSRLWGLRLLSEAEWLCAARGPENLEYPWGPDWREGAANVRDGSSAANVDDPLFAADISWCGVRGLAGNVSERIDGELVIGGAYRMVRDSARSRPANPNNRPVANASVGFRVALDVEPR